MTFDIDITTVGRAVGRVTAVSVIQSIAPVGKAVMTAGDIATVG